VYEQAQAVFCESFWVCSPVRRGRRADPHFQQQVDGDAAFSPARGLRGLNLAAARNERGGLILMLSVMLFFAYRDPARNVAILDALTVGLCILAFTPLWSLHTLDTRGLIRAM
jgi:hypothetical protein